MKTMKLSGKVIRVADNVSESKRKEGWSYVPKSEFKKTRPAPVVKAKSKPVKEK